MKQDDFDFEQLGRVQNKTEAKADTHGKLDDNHSEKANASVAHDAQAETVITKVKIDTAKAEQIQAAELSAPYTLIKGYLNTAQQAALLKEVEDYPLTRPAVFVFGKHHPIPRSQVWFADKGCDYFYSGLFIEAQPWPYYAQKLRFKLEREFGLQTNGVLVNRYADGHESMGWHSDDEKEIQSGTDIASVTLGASRDFFIRHKQTLQKECVNLESGDLLIMHWPMQSDWEHSLPKRLKVDAARINFTFRCLIPNYHQQK